jgi:hypothetical protein
VEISENEFGCQTVSLTSGDDLGQVPRSHRWLISKDIKRVFPGVPRYFASIASNAPFPRMVDWLQAILWEGRWELLLERLDNRDKLGRAGFYWRSERVRGAIISLPVRSEFRGLPAALVKLYKLVGSVNWMGGAADGSIWEASEAHPLSAYEFDFRGDPIDPGRTAVWGSQNGNMLIADLDTDRAGWLDLPTNEVRLIGTVAETIDWVFAELLAGRGPSADRVSLGKS